MEKTFVIIKPDAIERNLIGKIISRFEDKGLRIEVMHMKRLNEAWCRKHYEHLFGAVYARVQNFMLSGDLIGMILIGPEAIEVVRNMIGATNSLDALPGTIRGDFGTLPVHRNLVHASDSPEAVDHEARLFFYDIFHE